MGEEAERTELLAALRGYLEELQESGVDGLPLTAPLHAQAGPAATAESLAAIRAELEGCKRCQLGRGSALVFGSGNPQARLLFVGESPGEEEERQGEPLAGEAGELLTKIIQAMGFKRSDVYLCNLLKCRSNEGRTPLPEEIEQCHPFLLRQVRAIAPAVIVALGTCASQTLLASKEPISRLRGRFHDCLGIPLMPTFHPAFLLAHPERKREVWADMQQVMGLLGKADPRQGE